MEDYTDVTVMFQGGEEIIFSLNTEQWEDLDDSFRDDRAVKVWRGVSGEDEAAIAIRLDRVLSIHT